MKKAITVIRATCVALSFLGVVLVSGGLFLIACVIFGGDPPSK